MYNPTFLRRTFSFIIVHLLPPLIYISINSYIYVGRRACDRLLDLCRGIDHTVVVDDEGGPPKTLSVENSFRRGTTTTMTIGVGSTLPAQWHDKLLGDLYRRLPRLFDDRTAWSTHPELAYPTTIRLTVRLVVAKTVVEPQ
jgi:hypothetical protein